MTTTPASSPTAPPPTAPVASTRGVHSSAFVLAVISEHVADLVLRHNLVEPDGISCTADRCHLYFDDDAALWTLMAWAEQLDAAVPRAWTIDDPVGDDELVGIHVLGAVRNLEVHLHLVTRVQISRYASTEDLRGHAEADRRQRAEPKPAAEALSDGAAA